MELDYISHYLLSIMTKINRLLYMMTKFFQWERKVVPDVKKGKKCLRVGRTGLFSPDHHDLGEITRYEMSGYIELIITSSFVYKHKLRSNIYMKMWRRYKILVKLDHAYHPNAGRAFHHIDEMEIKPLRYCKYR